MNSQGRRGGGPYSKRGSSSSSSTTTTTKRSFVPNIAAAGRLEKADRDVPGTSQQSNEGEAGSAANGRKRHFVAAEERGDHLKQQRRTGREGIIQSEGVFTFPGRLDSSSTPAAARAHVNGVKVEPFDLSERMNGTHPGKFADSAGGGGGDGRRQKKPSTARGGKLSYADEKLTNGFISDAPKVERIPIVFPVGDEPQFRRFLTKKARRRLETGEGRPPPTKDEEEVNPGDIKREMLDEPEPSSASSRPDRAVGAGTRLRQMMKESDGSLMLLQLPSTFAPQSPPTESSGGAAGPVGKLQFLRDGRVVIRSDGRRMGVVEAIPSGCYEIAANITTNAAPNTTNEKPMTTTTMVNDDEAMCSVQRREPLRIGNKLTVLGDIKHSFLCTDPSQR